MKKTRTVKANKALHRLNAHRAKREAAEAKAKAKAEAKAAKATTKSTKPAKKKTAKFHEPTDTTQPVLEVTPEAQFDFHPYCELLPRMNSDELEALQEDIRKNGQREPGVILEGKILDGRNRYICCQKLNRPFAFIAFDSALHGSPISYVISKATHRNMDDTQKACSAVGIQDELVKQTEAIRIANLKHQDIDKEQVPSREESREQAGNLFGVSGRYVSDARWLRENNADLFFNCFNGFEKLSRAKRECQRQIKSLSIAAKAKESIKSFPNGHPDIEIVTGDCLELAEAQKSASAQLIFCDPNYNIAYEYGDGKIADNQSPEEYMDDVAVWMGEARRILKPSGSLFVLISDEYAAEYRIALGKSGFILVNWIIWYETFGNNCASKFNRTKRHLFYAVKSLDSRVFNIDAVTRTSDRAAKYGDKRAAPGGKIWDDIWGINPAIPRLVDNDKERMPGFPTQLPLALVQPIVECASDPGDLVMDFFTGSGTTPVACLRTGRKFRGFEIDPGFADASRVRVQAEITERKCA